jgi:hypothetical protein
MINRAAVILRCKEPMVRWINDADPSPEDKPITLSEANEERTVYLISDEDADTKDKFERWLKRNFIALFEAELEGWYTDEDLWPKNRTWKLFTEWLDVECHTVIEDTVQEELYDDEI